MNFTRDVVDAASPAREALITVGADDRRRAWTFGELSDRAARLAGTLAAHGVGRGDVVMTLMGNRVEWVLTLLACFRTGAIALPCTEQLRAKDLALRLHAAAPAAIVADPRDLSELEAAGVEAAGTPVLVAGEDALLDAEPAACAELAADDPALIIFTSGTSGEPKAVVTASVTSSAKRCRASTGSMRTPASWSGALRRPGGRSPRATPSSPHGYEGRGRFSTTPASMRRSAWRSSSVRASTCCAWRRRSTA